MKLKNWTLDKKKLCSFVIKSGLVFFMRMILYIIPYILVVFNVNSSVDLFIFVVSCGDGSLKFTILANSGVFILHLVCTTY